MRGGARRPDARRSLSTLSVRSRAPTKQMGPSPRSSLPPIRRGARRAAGGRAGERAEEAHRQRQRGGGTTPAASVPGAQRQGTSSAQRSTAQASGAASAVPASPAAAPSSAYSTAKTRATTPAGRAERLQDRRSGRAAGPGDGERAGHHDEAGSDAEGGDHADRERDLVERSTSTRSSTSRTGIAVTLGNAATTADWSAVFPARGARARWR